MSTSEKIVLMNKRRIERALMRIAHQVMERNSGGKEMMIFGIKTRGFAVAEVLKNYLESLSGSEVRLHPMVMDDSEAKPAIDPESFSDRYVLLVDDVIFTGATMFKALNICYNNYQPEEVHTVTLVDRGHRKFPVTAEFVGLELPTKLDEHVSVEASENELQQVFLNPSLH